MKKIIKKLAVPILILIASGLVGVILLFLVYLLPTDIMREHVSESVQMQVWEWDYYKWIPKDATSVSDGFTDGLMINIAIHDVEDGAIYDALLNPCIWYEDTNCMSDSLQKICLGDLEESYSNEYARYWHGYLIFLKPLLLIFNYYRIRWINTLLGCIAISAILLLLYKRFKSCKYSVVFLLAYFFLNPIVMRASLQFSTVFYIIATEYIVALIWGDRLYNKRLFEYLFLLSGIMTAFFDLLTYPAATLGMLLVLQLLLYSKKFIDNIFLAFKSSVMWLFGYAGMLAEKWIVAELVTGESVISGAINEIKYRSSAEVVEIDGVFSWQGLFERQFSWLSDENAILFKMALITFIAGIVMLIVTKRVKVVINASQLVCFLLFSLIPIARYIVLANHSYVHSMTYREQITAVMALSCAVVSSLEKKGEGISESCQTQ